LTAALNGTLAVKLGDHYFVRLERAPEEAAEEVTTQKAS
jgi:hypothetical protein